SALLGALSEGIALYFQIGQDLAFWYAGGVSGTTWMHLKVMAPWLLAAMVGAMFLSRSITLLSLGEEVSIGLGQRTKTIKIIGMLFVLVLAGAAVSVVGAVGFVGLIVPHVARFLVGYDYRWIIPCYIIYGGLFVVFGYLVARMIHLPYDILYVSIFSVIGVT